MLGTATSSRTTPNSHDELRRLRFSNAINEAESIPGFLARCAADHPVPWLATIYEEIEFEGRLPGRLQFAAPDILERLAIVTGCDPAALMRNTGYETRKKVIAFGDLEVLSETIDCRVRRIAPRTLAEHNFHRCDWLLKTLPFCPISGELLVSRCPHCHKTLGWTYTAGLDNCEHCEETIPPSSEHGLKGRLLEHYRSFSRLVSLDREARADEWLSLPSVLHDHSPGVVVSLAIRVHRHLRDLRGTSLRASLHSLAPYEIADIISEAMVLLHGWPNSVQDTVQSKIATLSEDHESFVSLWRRLKAITKPTRETGLEQADLLLSALPDLARPVWRSFAPPYRVYLQQEARLKTRLKASQLAAASACLTTTQLPSAGKRNIFYKADEIDALRQLTENTLSLSAVAQGWGMPNYAIEQLAANYLLEHADEPILGAIYSQQRIRRSSVKELTDFLRDHRLKSKPRKNSAPLANVMRMHGGNEKPWAAVIDAMRTKRVVWWSKGGKIDAKSLLIDPAEIFALNDLETHTARSAVLASPGISKKDACEILNVTPSQFKAIEAEHRLKSVRLGKADVILKGHILKIAAAWVAGAEIQERLQGEGRKMDWQRQISSLGKRSAGWPRAEVHQLFGW